MRAIYHLLLSAAVLAVPAHASTAPQDTVALAASEPLTLGQFADALGTATGKPVLIGLTPDRSYLRDDRGHRIKAVWNGSLADLLNAVAPRFGVQWAIENDAILFYDSASARPKAPAPKVINKVELVDVAPSQPAAQPVVPAKPVMAPVVQAQVVAPPVPAPIAIAPPAPQVVAAPASVPAAVVATPVRAPSAPVQPRVVFAPQAVVMQGASVAPAIPSVSEESSEAIVDVASYMDSPAVQAVSSRPVPRAVGRRAPVVPGVDLVSSNTVGLDAKEAYGVELANRWKANPDKPRQGNDGTVRYLYGATLPTLVCSPLEVCAIQLQPGEVVNDVHAGDTARWRITPANSGAGENATTLVIVKPIDAGLTTNLFIATDRRVYTIKLVSSQKAWMPVMAFDYPDDVQRQWASFRQRQTQQVQRDQEATLPTGEARGQNIASLDFAFRISGDRPRWSPTRVYSDGLKTYIQFPSAQFGDEAPALVELDGGSSTQMVNYRVVGDRYVVDHVIERAALISGVGRNQTRVVIDHKAERN